MIYNTDKYLKIHYWIPDYRYLAGLACISHCWWQYGARFDSAGLHFFSKLFLGGVVKGCFCVISTSKV